MNIGIKKSKVSFNSIWYNPKINDIPPEIKNTDNQCLNAIFSIYQDFKPEGHYRKLKDVRNGLTHRFIRVKEFYNEVNDENMSEEELVKYTLQLAKIVRNVIIYLLCFVHIEESKRKKEIKGKIGVLASRKIPDNLKNF